MPDNKSNQKKPIQVVYDIELGISYRETEAEELAYWNEICPHCHFPQMSCDCPQFDSEGNEL